MNNHKKWSTKGSQNPLKIRKMRTENEVRKNIKKTEVRAGKNLGPADPATVPKAT